MMDFNTIHEDALKRASSVLNNRFDVEAYLVYCMALENMARGKSTDLVANSKIDEALQEMLTLFVNFSKISNNEVTDEGVNLLTKFLGYLTQVVTELCTFTKNQKYLDLISKTVGRLNANLNT